MRLILWTLSFPRVRFDLAKIKGDVFSTEKNGVRMKSYRHKRRKEGTSSSCFSVNKASIPHYFQSFR